MLLYREPGPNVPNPEAYRKASSLRIWVSASSALPVLFQHQRISFDNPTATLTVTRALSDYRQAQGILVPLRQDRLVGQRLIQTLHLADIQFNVSLFDAEFEIVE